MENLSVFFIPKSCFLGGVSASNIKNIYRYPAVQPGSFSHGSWITLALCPVNGWSAPRCVYMSHVSSAEFCDSNMDLRGVSQRELPTVKSFSWEFLVSAGIYFILVKFIFSFWCLCTSLHNCQRTRGQALLPLFFFCWSWWKLTSVVFICTKSFTKCESQKGALKIAECLKQSVWPQPSCNLFMLSLPLSIV